jgi:hypothetical protein
MGFDSGSTVSVCSKSVVVSAGITHDLYPQKTLKVANGEVTPVLGSVVVTVTANGTTDKNLLLYIVDSFLLCSVICGLMCSADQTG